LKAQFCLSLDLGQFGRHLLIARFNPAGGQHFGISGDRADDDPAAHVIHGKGCHGLSALCRCDGGGHAAPA
jgi:hypothetical protein